MRRHVVYIRHENGEVQEVATMAMGENAAVQNVAAQDLGGVIFSVRDARYIGWAA